jgi:hypothetical protein
MAQGLEAELTQSSGLASVRCAEPGSDLWFVGPGQQNGGSQVQLDLMNVDSTAASVDVSIINDGGQVQAGDDNGITVPPHQTVTESLSSVAHGSSVVAIEVHTSIGRVAADVSAESHGVTSWLPSTAGPSTRLVIPGVPPSGSTAGLFVADPGPSTAKVTVTAITPQGHISPFGSQSVDLPGQSASYVALSPLGGTTAALQITSNVPVVAAVLVPGSGPGVLTAATAPISEQAVVAGNTSSGGMAASVLLSAPGAAAQVRLTEIAPASRGGASVTVSQVLSVKAGRTLATPVKAPKGAKHDSAFALVITPLPGSGPLYAARVETQGQNSVVSIIPAASALTTISLPPVRDSYDAISPLTGRCTGTARSAEVAVAGVDDLGIHPEDLGELLDHHVEEQLAQLVLVFGPGQQRPPVQHDARSGGRVSRVGVVRRGMDDAGQRHRFVLTDGVGVGDLLDRELHVG